MKIKTTVKAGFKVWNHNETLAGSSGLKVRTNVKSGGVQLNHSETVVR